MIPLVKKLTAREFGKEEARVGEDRIYLEK
jgi:hypothetical protein